MKNKLMLLITALILASCGAEEFSSDKSSQSTSTGSVAESSNTLCSSFTLVKPPVDFLFLVDNSTSQNYMDSGLKEALNRTFEKVSERFDYRILLAPIYGSGLTGTALVADNPDNLTSTGRSLLKSKSSALSTVEYFTKESSSFESGISRTQELLSNGKSAGIFRSKAHTIVVLMSNGDNVVEGHSNEIESYARTQATTLKNYVESNFSPLQFRFMTLVPHKNKFYCSHVGNKNPSYGYIAASSVIGNGSSSYDICAADGSYENVLDGVNNSIEDELIEHKYNYWPIIIGSKSSSLSFDPDEIEVYKNLNGIQTQLEKDSQWEYEGYLFNQNTRYSPTAGEPYSGYFVKLKSTGRAQYPECITVKTKEIAVCYQYLKLNSRPDKSTITLIINGKTIPESSTNGWSYTDTYQSKLQINTQCSGSNYAPTAEYETGYFLKLNGDAIYGNSSSVKITYEPAKI